VFLSEVDLAFSRRHLGPVSSLVAFEAAARLGSVSAAARELHLTQSAVSRQIKALEQHLDVALFIRENQSLKLTSGGMKYALEVRDGLYRLTEASMRLRANPLGGTLSLGILPTFGTRWLAPRLPDFLSAHPEIIVNLMTRLGPFDFHKDGLDAAIHFGHNDWQGTDSLFLRHEVVIPVCAPQIAKKFAFVVPDDLRNAPLLHMLTRPEAWERWFKLHGASSKPVAGMMVDQFATAAQLARSGLGVALIPEFLVEQELSNGDLIRALDLPMELAESYYLVWPNFGAKHTPLEAFKLWLIDRIKSET
jgi:LysR family glycine cleavage system transcriptional activator